jgi:hypothetical protein
VLVYSEYFISSILAEKNKNDILQRKIILIDAMVEGIVNADEVREDNSGNNLTEDQLIMSMLFLKIAQNQVTNIYQINNPVNNLDSAR